MTRRLTFERSIVTVAMSTPVRPATSVEFAARIAEALQVRVTGSNSMPLLAFDADGGRRPAVEISTLRMNKVIEQSPPDMTICVQAGMTLEALQRHLAWQNQWLPVDPPAVGGRLPGQRTIGGLIATNSLGPLRLGLGGGADWRLLVLGMKWVDGHGKLLATGSRTVKNVAGYAVHRMLIGSCGALGAIAEVTLRTFARPADEQCVIFFAERAADAEALLAALLLSPTTPAYVEVAGGATFGANPLGLPTLRPAGMGRDPPGADGGGMVVVAGYLGRPEACAAQIATVRALAEARAMESIAQTAAQAGRLRLWLTTEPATGEGGLGFRLQVRSSKVTRMVAKLEEIGVEWVVSEAATGVVRGVMQNGQARGKFQEVCGGGRMVVTQGPAITPGNSGLAARLKAALDPQNRFGSYGAG